MCVEDISKNKDTLQCNFNKIEVTNPWVCLSKKDQNKTEETGNTAKNSPINTMGCGRPLAGEQMKDKKLRRTRTSRRKDAKEYRNKVREESCIRHRIIQQTEKIKNSAESMEAIRITCNNVEKGNLISENGIGIIQDIVELMAAFSVDGGFTESVITLEEIVGTVIDAYQVGSESFSIEDAVRWGGDFHFPTDIRETDEKELSSRECGNDLSKLCALKQQRLAADRLSVDKVHACITEEMVSNTAVWPTGRQDKEMLLRVAEGLDVPVAEDFIPNGRPPKLRAKYVRVASAVNKGMDAQWRKGLLIVLPTSVVQAMEGVHFSSTHWTEKQKVEAGRPLGDATNTADGDCPLNDLRLHEVLKGLWGEINHPTLEDICLMILSEVDKFGWDNITLWKMDLKSAFTLMFFKRHFVKLLAFELTEGLTMLHVAGFFGWTGSPFAFEAITRVLRHYISVLIWGVIKMYVDDVIGVSQLSKLTSDMAHAKAGIQRLLGSKSIADEKSESARVLDVIGWRISLITRTVTMSPQNLAKTVYAFFVAKEEEPMEVKELEGLASRASRCAQVCRAMRPYKAALYDALKGHANNRRAMVTLGTEAQVDIWMWRVYLCIIQSSSGRMERPLMSFRVEVPSFVISFDASLDGYGVGISTVPLEGASGNAWETLVSYTALRVPFDFGRKSNYQNNCEFVAIIIGMWLAGRKGYRNGSYVLKGDSISALQWAKEDRAESMICRRASICFSLLSIQLNMRVSEAIHVPGVENIICDGLSRGKLGNEVGIPVTKFVDFEADTAGMAYLQECDPLKEIGDKYEHVKWLQLLTGILHGV